MESLGQIVTTHGLWPVVAAVVVLFIGGFTKGVVGFALPMITVSGVGSVLSAELAIASIILPAMLTNIWQAFRNGARAAWESLLKYRTLFIVLVPVIFLTANIVASLPEWLLFVGLGSVVTAFALLDLLGWRLQVPTRWKVGGEVFVGTLSGIFGGLAGVWGPPIVAYLSGRDTEKTEQVRTLGIAFLLGAIVLFIAHRRTGLMDAEAVAFSGAMAIPALIGIGLGFRVQDRLDAKRFKRATLIVLALAGLNLLRRGLF